MSFGKWYEEKKAAENGGDEGSWFDMEMQMPEAMQNMSFTGLKESMEAQMPKKIMGMGYQERFQVSLVCLIPFVTFFSSCLFSLLCFTLYPN